MAYGPGESRFVEEKRHFEKPIPISDLVSLDRERCILCDRCTRFAKDVAGDPLIHFIDRGNQTQVNTFPDDPFASYFSGNTVQICPVGALDGVAVPLQGPPVGPRPGRVHLHDVLGRLPHRRAVEPQRGPPLPGRRHRPGQLGLAVRQGPVRLRGGQQRRPPRRAARPRRRSPRSGRLGPRALDRCRGDPVALTRIGSRVIGGARLTNEDAYAWAKLAKGVIGTDNVDAQLGDGLPAEVVLGLPRATIDEACAPGGTVLLLGPDAKEELPVLFLRLRHAVVNDGVTHRRARPAAHVGLGPRRGDPPPPAGRRGRARRRAPGRRRRPRGRRGRRGRRRHRRASCSGAGPSRSCSAGQPRRRGRGRGRRGGGHPRAPTRGALPVRASPGNVHGALDMGLAPGCCPAGSPSTTAAVVPATAAGRPSQPDAASTPPASSQAAAAGRIDASSCSAPIRSPTSPTPTSPRGRSPGRAPSSPSTSSSPSGPAGRRRARRGRATPRSTAPPPTSRAASAPWPARSRRRAPPAPTG